jgi:hypothetical protein
VSDDVTVAAGASNTEISGEGRAILAVADFVRFISLLGGGPSSAWQHDVPTNESTCWVLACRRRKQVGYQSLTVSRHLLQDAILRVQWFSSEKQLRDPAIDMTANIKMDVRRSDTPTIASVGPRLDRSESKAALAIGELGCVALKVRVQRCGIGIGRVVVTTKGVGLPEFHMGPRDRFAALAEDPSHDVNGLPLCATAVPSEACEIGVPFERPYDRIERAGHRGCCCR